jgi:transcription elongation factor SPT6
MLKAEEEGLVEVRVEHETKNRLMMELYEYIMSENQSEIAEQWNRERKEVIDRVMVKFEKACQKSVKESIKNETEDRVALACRRAFYDKLDQAPYNTSILVKGDIPRVLALSPGMGIPGKDAIVGVFMDENGKVVESLKLVSLKDETSREDLLKVIRTRKPDVIGIAGFSVATHRMKEDLQALIAAEELMCSENDKAAPLEVIYVDDEMARIFRMSPKGKAEFPQMVPMQRYCIALCRYVQDPLIEYASQGKDILSLSFDPAQHLIPQDKLMRQLESALVDVVNMVGLQINEALKDPRLGNLLQYIAGLGPRKASNIVKIVGMSPTGRLNGRTELLGEGVKYASMDLTVFANCASFLWIEHDKQDENSEVLDGTRIHPEDYELGRKMAADAMEYDEEDVTQLVNSGGPSAVIAELLNGHEDKLNELILEDYADELESNFGQRKRATLETIRNELINPYQELRSDFKRLSVADIFTMLTGETKESLQPGMVVPVNIRKLSERFIAVRLDCGVDGNVASDMMSDNSNFHVYSSFESGQTVQGCIMSINYETFYAELSLRGRDTRKLFKSRSNEHGPDEWDDQQEEKDKAKLSISNQEQQRTTRVIKHPLFKPFNSRQAEEYLKGMSRGDAVIRPSSNGMDHIAVTWKVSDGIYQHIDVLELDKENEFTVGKTLRVGGKYSYSDLDELIVEHVKAMARKMDEMTSHPKFRNDKSRKDTEQFLVSYTQAAPKKSIYTFTFDYKHPGYFILSFKAGRNAPINCWPVKVVPGGFQLKEQAYPDMMSLCNVSLTLYSSPSIMILTILLRVSNSSIPPPYKAATDPAPVHQEVHPVRPAEAIMALLPNVCNLPLVPTAWAIRVDMACPLDDRQ